MGKRPTILAAAVIVTAIALFMTSSLTAALIIADPMHPAGTIVSGVPEAIAPYMTVSTVGTNEIVLVREGITPPEAYGAGDANIPNACVFDGWGITDAGDPNFIHPDGVLRPYHWKSKHHEYIFTFADGITINSFLISVADWSDFMPNPPNADHLYGLSVTGYDAGDNVVAVETLTLETDDAGFTRYGTVLETGETGNTATMGDACKSQEGEPGNYTFELHGTGIVKVVVKFKDEASIDPYIAFHNVAFSIEDPSTPNCTLTQGYWKRHADPSKKQYDDTWDALLGEDFFLSGDDYLGVLNTTPKGNGYYILAHQFIAADLNLSAPSTSATWEVYEAYFAAEDLFTLYTPDDVAGDKDLNDQFKALVKTLDDYNNGVIGPGHCG